MDEEARLRARMTEIQNQYIENAKMEMDYIWKETAKKIKKRIEMEIPHFKEVNVEISTGDSINNMHYVIKTGGTVNPRFLTSDGHVRSTPYP